jgi:hypothetical protein
VPKTAIRPYISLAEGSSSVLFVPVLGPGAGGPGAVGRGGHGETGSRGETGFSAARGDKGVMVTAGRVVVMPYCVLNAST